MKEKFENILKELQANDLYSLWQAEDVMKYLGGKVVATEIDRDMHRWYELSGVVCEFGGRFIEAYGVSHMNSEGSSYSDIGIKTEFFEVEREEVVAYNYKRVEVE